MSIGPALRDSVHRVVRERLRIAKLLLMTLGLLAGCQQESPPETSSTAASSQSNSSKADGQSNDTAENLTAPKSDSGEPAQQTPDGVPLAVADGAKSADHNSQQVTAPTNDSKKTSGDAIPITFDDLNLRMQADVAFRPWMLTDRVNELNGKRVRISGYMHGGVAQLKNVKEFVLLRNTECLFGKGGQADHLVKIAMVAPEAARYTTRPVEVIGSIKIDPFEGPDGNTWSIYTMHVDSFKELRARE